MTRVHVDEHASIWGTMKSSNITMIECSHDGTDRAGYWDQK